MRRWKYKILKILYYVIRVHRFEYYFVRYSQIRNLCKQTAATARSFSSSLLFFFFFSFSPTLCSLRNSRIPDSVGYIHSGQTDTVPSSYTVAHKMQFVCSGARAQRRKSVDDENGFGRRHAAIQQQQSASTKNLYSRSVLHSFFGARKGCSTLKWHKQFRIHVKIHKFRFLHAIHLVLWWPLLQHNTLNEHEEQKS